MGITHYRKRVCEKYAYIFLCFTAYMELRYNELRFDYKLNTATVTVQKNTKNKKNQLLFQNKWFLKLKMLMGCSCLLATKC